MSNSFTDDHFKDKKFDYMLANPPFGVEWKPEMKYIKDEQEHRGFGGRFGAGLPRINDGSFLFLQHMIRKMKPVEEGGTRLGIVFSGSPLFTGSAGSGESDIRKWIIEHDWLDCIIAMPDQLFYNTGINTYIWILTNRKEEDRKGKIQLIDATSYFEKMRKSLGNKRHEISKEQISEITRLYGLFTEGQHVKIFDNEDFGYYRITVERPLRLNFRVDDERLERLRNEKQFLKLATSKKRKDEAAIEREIEEGRWMQEAIIYVLEGLKDEGTYKNREEFQGLLKTAFKEGDLKLAAPLMKAVMSALGERDETADICTNRKGEPEPDTGLRDYENVPLKDDIEAYMEREVQPHVPDARVDESKTKTGYEINFNRYFYEYTPPRELEDIRADILRLEEETEGLLKEILK